MEDTNRWSSTVQSWTVDRKGFVVCDLWAFVARTTDSTSVVSQFYINGKRVGYAVSQATDPHSNITSSANGVFPVDVGDVVSYRVTVGPNYTQVATINYVGCQFIPGKWV